MSKTAGKRWNHEPKTRTNKTPQPTLNQVYNQMASAQLPPPGAMTKVMNPGDMLTVTKDTTVIAGSQVKYLQAGDTFTLTTGAAGGTSVTYYPTYSTGNASYTSPLSPTTQLPPPLPWTQVGERDATSTFRELTGYLRPSTKGFLADRVVDVQDAVVKDALAAFMLTTSTGSIPSYEASCVLAVTLLYESLGMTQPSRDDWLSTLRTLLSSRPSA